MQPGHLLIPMMKCKTTELLNRAESFLSG